MSANYARIFTSKQQKSTKVCRFRWLSFFVGAIYVTEKYLPKFSRNFSKKTQRFFALPSIVVPNVITRREINRSFVCAFISSPRIFSPCIISRAKFFLVKSKTQKVFVQCSCERRVAQNLFCGRSCRLPNFDFYV